MIREKTSKSEIVIDLNGPEGNAYVLIGYAKRFAKQLGWDGDQIIAEMKAGDYDNLIEVFDGYFGDFVILER
jgi:hypothetical protein